jgi:hypothetical protein
LDAGVLGRAAEGAGEELALAVVAQAEVAAGEEQHGDVVAAADAAGALLAELLVLEAGARVGVVDVVDVGGRAVVGGVAVAAAFLGEEGRGRGRRRGELGALLLRVREVGAQHVHHGFRGAHFGLPVLRLRVELREPVHELLVLALHFLHLRVLLAQLARESLLRSRDQLARVALPLLLNKALELLILQKTKKFKTEQLFKTPHSKFAHPTPRIVIRTGTVTWIFRSWVTSSRSCCKCEAKFSAQVGFGAGSTRPLVDTGDAERSR